jgi:hypothetical protein
VNFDRRFLAQHERRVRKRVGVGELLREELFLNPFGQRGIVRGEVFRELRDGFGRWIRLLAVEVNGVGGAEARFEASMLDMNEGARNGAWALSVSVRKPATSAA